jgi:hypothetical protein
MKTLFIALASNALCVIAYSQELSIGSLSVRIGADKFAVIRDASSRFHVINVAGQDGIMLSERKPPNVNVIGSITFAGGKVAGASRTWGHFSRRSDPAEVGKALFAAIESVSGKSGVKQPVVTTEVDRIPGGEFKRVRMQYGSRSVSILTVDASSQSAGMSIQVTELISKSSARLGGDVLRRRDRDSRSPARALSQHPAAMNGRPRSPTG